MFSVHSWIVGVLWLWWRWTGLGRGVATSGLMCLIVRGRRHTYHNVASHHGVELHALINTMLESSVTVRY